MREKLLEKGFVSESQEVVRVAYLGQITNIGSGRVRKLLKDRSREGRDISMHNCAREKGSRHKITRNPKGSIFMPNNEY